ncbi:fungal-specific transcription factor domain-containing protein [Lipomyces tetrasporus]|uniref:Fungal-specific transcription factor domain-containing protein n=1 Tax=Lipomyces tetrasporus TaxID=54092 RepID=A0AAD7QRG8_9ASCO|nr:fungal-specific transcription factor domain-containing protein [Lipomyces tetrasporus]KAJ8100123.1 fungal-specific transcription factor domain-containing protein [Lipomyces tetrasporus]
MLTKLYRQRRKSKCSGEVVCSYCLRTNRKCVYDERTHRIPLTRLNLDNLEHRCKKLEHIIRTISPQTDIDQLVGNCPDSPSLWNSGLFSSIPRSLPDHLNHNPTDDDTYASAETLQDEEPIDPDEFEWDEGPFTSDPTQGRPTQDGMGTLELDRRESGYLGRSAGASLMRVVNKLLGYGSCTSDAGASQHDIGRRNSTEVQSVYVSQQYPNAALLAEQQLASVAVRDVLVDSYFRTFHPMYPILHEGTFRDQYLRMDPIRKNCHWYMLLRMVLALGTLAASTRANNDDYSFYLSARERFSAEIYESGTIELLQILLLMVNYLQKRDKPNSSYTLLGLAMRMAVGLGLHREFSNGSTSLSSHTAGKPRTAQPNTLKMEIRRRVWWTLYLFDSGSSITFGRPPLMAVPQQTVDVTECGNVEDSKLKLTDDIGPSVPYATPYSAFIAHSRLSIISNKVYYQFYTLSRHQRPLSEPTLKDILTCFEREMEDWRQNLIADFFGSNCSEWFTGPRAVVLWKAKNLQLLLYKSFLESAAVASYQKHTANLYSSGAYSLMANPYLRRCIELSEESIALISQFCAEIDRIWWAVSWYATYFLFQADLFLIVVILGFPEDHQTAIECQQQVALSKTLFKQLQVSNTVAGKCLNALERIERLLVVRRQNVLDDPGFAMFGTGAVNNSIHDGEEPPTYSIISSLSATAVSQSSLHLLSSTGGLPTATPPDVAAPLATTDITYLQNMSALPNILMNNIGRNFDSGLDMTIFFDELNLASFDDHTAIFSSVSAPSE